MTTDSYQVPVIKTNYAKILVSVFSDYGLDVHKLLSDSGLPPDLFESQSDFLPSESIKRLIFLTSSQLGVTKFFDLLALALRQRIIPYVLHQFCEYKTIGDAIAHINRIFVNDTPSSTVHYEVEHNQSWFCVYGQGKEGSYFSWSEAFAICYIIELIRTLSKQDQWLPQHVKVQTTDISLVKQILPKHCQLYIDQPRTAVHIPQEILDCPINIPQSALSPKPAVIEWHTSFTDSVFELLKPYVKEQDLSIEQAAELLNFSVRTFQRKLKSENTSFRKVKENLMFSVACELMEEGHSLTYISSQLGYTNISHFSRAFKRVSGLTPKLYQKSMS